MTAMSVRQTAQALVSPLVSPTRRRLHIVPPPEPRPAPMHPAERRMRDAGGPDDRATYACSCGYLFEARVTASVHCPHCDTIQDW